MSIGFIYSTCGCEFRVADVRIMSKAFGWLQKIKKNLYTVWENKWNEQLSYYEITAKSMS